MQMPQNFRNNFVNKFKLILDGELLQLNCLIFVELFSSQSSCTSQTILSSCFNLMNFQTVLQGVQLPSTEWKLSTSFHSGGTIALNEAEVVS